MKQLPPDDGVSFMTLNSGSQYRYPAKHINPGCACQTLEAPNRNIKDILKQGGIPILAIGTGENGRLNLRAKRHDGRTKYVVVQHTHFDGLASSRQGTITTCQLLRIAIRLGELQSKEVRDELCFWLDTLCEDQARASPSSVFKNAYSALIVDPSLQALHSPRGIDIQSHLADILAGHPRLALNKRLLLMSAHSYFDTRGRS